MNAEQVTQAVTAHLAAKLTDAVDATVAEAAADVRELISVPVGRSGGKVVRSKPGEPPRKETGRYRASWRHRTTQSGDTITGAAGTDTELGNWLNKGTSRMRARPHVERVYNELRGDAVQRIKSKL